MTLFLLAQNTKPTYTGSSRANNLATQYWSNLRSAELAALLGSTDETMRQNAIRLAKNPPPASQLGKAWLEDLAGQAIAWQGNYQVGTQLDMATSCYRI
jgi:hypothetical protein